MTKKPLIMLLIISVLTMTGCWDAFGQGFAQGYYGASYQPSYYQPYLSQPYHSYYNPTPEEHYYNDYFGIDDGLHHQQHHRHGY